MTSPREHRRRQRARSKAQRAVEAGILPRPERCERCGQVPDGEGPASVVQAHHDTYDRPYDVRWLCAWCHYEVEKQGLARARRQRELRRGLLEYRRWRRTVGHPTCGDSGGWSTYSNRPCKKGVAEKGRRCSHHPREKERPIILRGGPADPTALQPAS